MKWLMNWMSWMKTFKDEIYASSYQSKGFNYSNKSGSFKDDAPKFVPNVSQYIYRVK